MATEQQTELRTERRTDRHNRPSVAPFINGWNVWDIPPEHWVYAVQQAILHAYELGWQHCNDKHGEVQSFNFPIDAHFKESRRNAD